MVERIKEQLHEKGINLTSIKVDNALWLLSKDETVDYKPFHRTRTICY